MRDRTKGIESLEWLLSKGVITKEMYDEAMKVTDEQIEYNELRTEIGYCIAHKETEHLAEMEARLKELEKIIMEQDKGE